MTESVIVTVNDLKRLTSIGEHVDPELLSPHLLLAQQMNLEPVLGIALYDDIISRFNNNQLTGDTQVLYENYIVPALAYSAWSNVSIFLAVHTNRTGINTTQTDAIIPATDSQMDIYRRDVGNLRDFYLNRLEEYLVLNKDKFPLYRQSTTPQSNGGEIFLGYKNIPKKYWGSEFIF